MRTGYQIAIEMLRRMGPGPTQVTTDDGRGGLHWFASIDEAREVPETMRFFIDPGEDDGENAWWGDPRPRGAADYTFAMWSADEVGYLDMNEGYVDPIIIPRTLEAWVEKRSRRYR